MIEFLKTLILDIEATAEDSNLPATFPPVENNDEVLGFLNPQFRKYLSLLFKIQGELKKTEARMSSLSQEEQMVEAASLERQSSQLEAYSNLFWHALQMDLAATSCPDIWSKDCEPTIKKEWTVVNDVNNLNTVVILVGAPPTDKKKLN